MGPDLGEVAGRLGLTPEAVSDLHQGAEFTVSFYGFAPGYAYLDGLPEGMRLDRKPVPKHRRASQLIPERRLRVDRGCVTHETLQVHDAKG